MESVRAWLVRDRVVGVVARGRRVCALVARASDDGRRYRHQVVECTPGRPERVLTPAEVDCVDPVLLSDGSVVVRTDGGEPGGPMQVAERAPTGDWRTWTDAPGGVVAFAAAESTVVVLERVAATDAPWGVEVVVAESGPARFWRDWFTEDAFQIVMHDRRSGTRRPLGARSALEMSQCALVLSPDGRTLVHTPARIAEDGVLQRGLEVWALPGRCDSCTIWGPPNTDHSHPVFSPDGQSLAFVRHTRRANAHGRRQLMVRHLESGEETVIAPGWPHWLEPVAWTDAHGIVCLAVVDCQKGAFAVRPGDAAPRRIDTATWSWDGLSVGDQVWGVGSRLQERPQVRPVDHTGPASVVQPWHVEPSCPTLFWPADTDDGPRPLVVMVHGGPVSAWTDSWHPRQAAAFFHNLGCHVLLPNPPGSIGHGDAHVEAIWHAWDYCTEALITLLHQASERADIGRIVLFGGSFGGWAVNRLATRPDCPPVAGIVTHAGIFDHHAMLGACDEPAAFRWHLGPTPDHIHRAEPALHIGDWTARTLILHGALDYNVPVGQAVAQHHALERRGVPHRLVVFPDEGHHILEPRNKLRWWHEVGTFVRSVTGMG